MNIGLESFCPPKRLKMIRQSYKPIMYCESSSNLQGQSCIPSPKKHKRRESQLTERKDYSHRNSLEDDDNFLMLERNGSCEISFDVTAGNSDVKYQTNN